jgi:hypothetical protein
VSDELMKTWFITAARRGAPPAGTPNNDITAYIHYIDYYAAVGDAIAAVGNSGHVLLVGWGIDLETPVGSGTTQVMIGDLRAALPFSTTGSGSSGASIRRPSSSRVPPG